MIVETTHGRVRGQERRGVATWRGIPYASAPRFMPPGEVTTWAGVRDALVFGPFATQGRDARSMMMSGVTERTEMGEDCLVLNVYAPTDFAERKRPVVVWIHGGAFIMGAGSQPLYDGTSFAANHDVVVVTINYRLGLLGLMYMGDLLGELYEQGNVALLDQLAALRWVQQNIAAFGGDPAAVTVMGESAGAISIAHVLAIPASRGLFTRAILQSGAFGLVHRTRHDATKLATDVAAWLGVPPAALVDAPVERLVAAQLHLSTTLGLGAFAPYIDGVTLPGNPLEIVRGGGAAGVSLVLGSNRDEWALFDTFLGHQSTQLVVRQLRARFGAAMDSYHEQYRDARADRSDARAWVDLIGDMAFRIPMIHLAEAKLAHAPVWMYRFDFGTPMLGAAHALELPFVWNVIEGPFAQLVLGGDVASARPLADAMHGAWSSFIRTGSPVTTPPWPTYDAERRATLIFDRTLHVVDDPAGDLRRIWE